MKGEDSASSVIFQNCISKEILKFISLIPTERLNCGKSDETKSRDLPKKEYWRINNGWLWYFRMLWNHVMRQRLFKLITLRIKCNIHINSCSRSYLISSYHMIMHILTQINQILLTILLWRDRKPHSLSFPTFLYSSYRDQKTWYDRYKDIQLRDNFQSWAIL